MPIADPAARREYQRQWIARQRQQYLDGRQCELCGSTKDLEIDHVDPEQKVSHRIWSWAKKRREAELVKCQVLCADCHLEKTRAWRASKLRHGTDTMYSKYKCRCAPCCLAAKVARGRA